VAGVPEGADYVVARALAKVPADRYATGRMFAEDAQDLIDGRPPRHRARWTVPPPPLPAEPLSPEASLATIDELELEPLLDAIAPDADAPPTRRSPGPVPPRVARRVQLAGAAAALLVVGLLFTWSAKDPAPATVSEPRSSPASVPRVAAARLVLDFEHPLRTGRLRVWVDERLLVEEDLAGQVTKKLLAIKVRQGGLRQEMELAPGGHDIRVQVAWEDNEKTEHIFGTFKEGQTRRLEIRLGRLRKNLSVEWR
jgi:hypothetical protein